MHDFHDTYKRSDTPSSFSHKSLKHKFSKGSSVRVDQVSYIIVWAHSTLTLPFNNFERSAIMELHRSVFEPDEHIVNSSYSSKSVYRSSTFSSVYTSSSLSFYRPSKRLCCFSFSRSNIQNILIYVFQYLLTKFYSH